MSNEPKSIKNIFRDLSEIKGWDEKITEVRLPEIWEEITGENIARNAKFSRYDNGILFILTTSSTWRTELLLRKQKFIERINELLGQDFIRDIVIR